MANVDVARFGSNARYPVAESEASSGSCSVEGPEVGLTVRREVRQEKRDPLLRDFGDFGTSPDPASAGSRVHAWIRLAQIPITGHRP